MNELLKTLTEIKIIVHQIWSKCPHNLYSEKINFKFVYLLRCSRIPSRLEIIAHWDWKYQPVSNIAAVYNNTDGKSKLGRMMALPWAWNLVQSSASYTQNNGYIH